MPYSNTVMPSQANTYLKLLCEVIAGLFTIFFFLLGGQVSEAADLLVIRHGEATNNIYEFYSTNTSNPGYRMSNLTPVGQVQVRRLARELRKKGYNHRNVSCIVYSPLPRTRQTAELLAAELGISAGKLKSDQRIQDINVGMLEGKPAKNLPKDIDRWFEENATHGGERKEDVILRVLDAHNEFVFQGKHSGHVIMVTHHRPASVLLQKIKGTTVKLPRGGYAILSLSEKETSKPF